MFTLSYRAIDGFVKTRSFKTINGAHAFATRWVGAPTDASATSAVNSDGVGYIRLFRTEPGIDLRNILNWKPAKKVARDANAEADAAAAHWGECRESALPVSEWDEAVMDGDIPF